MGADRRCRGRYRTPQVRRAREWAEVADAHELDQERRQDAARLGVDLDSDQLAYPAALREVGDDPRARAALATAMADFPGRRPVEAMRSEQTALDRIRAVRERVQAADFQLDHAQADVKNQQPVSAGERLAAVRALLADGDRLLQEAASAAQQPADSPQVSDALSFSPPTVKSDGPSVGPRHR